MKAIHNNTFCITDGHIDYHGANGHIAKVPAKYDAIPIANTVNTKNLKLNYLITNKARQIFLPSLKCVQKLALKNGQFAWIK